MLLAIILFLSTALALEETPWTPMCRQAVLCNLVAGDVTRANGQFQKKYYDLATEISKMYLDKQTRPDYAKINNLMKEKGVNPDYPHAASSLELNELKVALAKSGIQMLESNETDHHSGAHTRESIMEYQKETVCSNKLSTCEAELSKLTKGPKFGCGWRTYSYMWFRCDTIKLWPAAVKVNLRPDQLVCSMLPECDKFREWEKFVGAKNLSTDWIKRKRSWDDVPEKKSGVLISTIDAPPSWEEDHLYIVVKSEDAIPDADYTKWHFCPPNTYAKAFRVLKALVGVAGLTIHCNKLKGPLHSRDLHLTNIISNITEPTLTTSPLFVCNGPIIGYNLANNREGTWTTFVHDLTATCIEHVEKQIPMTYNSSDTMQVRTLKCGPGYAACGIRASLLKPRLKDFERIYDLQLACCPVVFECEKVKEEYQYIGKFDLTKAREGEGESQLNFQHPTGFRFYKPWLAMFIPDTAFSTGLKSSFHRLESKLFNWTTVQSFDPINVENKTMRLQNKYIHRLVVVRGICDEMEYYPPQDPVQIKESCIPRTKLQFHSKYESEAPKTNLFTGVTYAVPEVNAFHPNESMLLENLDTLLVNGGINVTKFIDFNRTFTYSEKQETDIVLWQEIAVCNNNVTQKKYKIYTEKVVPKKLPQLKKCSPRDDFREIGRVENTVYPSGLKVHYELTKLGMDWTTNDPYLPTNVTFPNLKLALRQAIGTAEHGPTSRFTSLNWFKTRDWPVVGQFKKTYNFTVGFMNSVRFYQVVANCGEYAFYAGDEFYKVFDRRGVCVGGQCELEEYGTLQ